MQPLLTLASPLGHVTDKPLWEGNLFGIHVWWISNVTIMLVIDAIVTCLLVIPAARRIRTGQARTLADFHTQGVLGNLVESVCVFLRDEVFRDVLGDQTDNFTPILWTFFWYILICNLMGLIPLLDLTSLIGHLTGHPIGHDGHGIGGTATQSIWVTGALSVVAFLFYNAIALFKDPIAFFKHMTGGAPMLMWPIMIPVEIMGTFIKPFALAIRLFANMTGGHLVIAVLLSFVGPIIHALGGAAGGGLAVLPILGAAAINMLEILVAVVQAYIFTFLTCLFLGQLVIHEHEPGEHGGGHDVNVAEINHGHGGDHGQPAVSGAH